ncbi:SDR family NAD(P)-dependent oxidoreductase [Sphaerisporangium sp. NPDC051017]|uniref:SDR family NAD(P)-dependent oxidoreductase n=1 Tax=Sphaerisporangium sp. NPDC051017 TaxID=3154636 RepID=UPI0034494C5F
MTRGFTLSAGRPSRGGSAVDIGTVDIRGSRRQQRKNMNQPKTVVITGGSDGIGAAAARRLHREGHRVVIVGRSPRKTQAVAREIGADRYLADFTRLDEVRKLAAELNTAYPRIDVLANNAGGIFGDRAKTVDGFEKTFQINHLAQFLLTRLLMDRLIASNATVIQTASVGARMAGKVVLDDLDHDRDFTAVRAYCTAKLENILFTKELHRRYHSEGISTAAFHPGTVATSFATESDSFLKYITGTRLGRAFLITPDKGADQLVWLAQGRPGVDWISGTYYEKRKPAKRNNPQALDADLARRLWDRSEELLG